MTRETKVGLVVASSFLCLVGIVVASKWRRTDDPSEEQTVITAANNSKAAQNTNDTKAKDAAKSEKANEHQKSEPANVVTKPLDPLPLPPPLPNPQTDQERANNVFFPLPTPVDAAAGQATKPSDDETRKELERLRLEALQPNPTLPAPAPMPIQFSERPLDVNALGGLDKKDVAPLPLPSAVDTQVKPAAQNTVEKKDVMPLPPPASGLGSDPAPKPAPLMPLDEKKLPAIPSTSGVGNAADFPPLPQPKDPATAKPLDVTPFGLPSDVTDKSLPKDIPTIPSTKGSPTLPPLGVGGNALPPVRESSFDVHKCKDGEATFATLSKNFYGTDDYAEALQAFNRKHANVVVKGENLLLEQPRLTMGQDVLRPSRELLEKEYGHLIRKASADAVRPATTVPTVKLTPPSPLTTSPPPITNTAPVASGRTYTVANANGESILDIAERQLGDRGRWTDIYRLNQSNPAVQPQFRIPAGTQLKMPN